jgi:hypothetical protein
VPKPSRGQCKATLDCTDRVIGCKSSGAGSVCTSDYVFIEFSLFENFDEFLA